MTDEVYFSELSTKSLEPINSDQRFFEGYLTVEVKDKQGEITIVDELYKVLPVWMDRGAPISDTHSNRIIGKGINFAKTIYKGQDGSEYPAIKITGKIHKNYELDNDIWDKIKNGEYKGLSFGGATKSDRTPKVMKDGSVAYALKDLEHYEVAVCKDPAVPLALITDFNPIAKSMVEGSTEDRDGKMVIKCSKFGCVVDKACWEGYEQQGMKEKDGKQVPNCVPKSSNKAEDEEELDEKQKAELRGIETFEGKVQALMREGKPRANAERIVGSFTKKDSPTGHDPTLVAHSPDTPREMEMAKGKDHSNTGGDNHGSLYNQNGAEQRVNSDKAEPNVQQGVAGGEVPPQWTGSGSPYPKGERPVVKRKKIIKVESWQELQKSAFELDMQWRVIDMLSKKRTTSAGGHKQRKQVSTGYGVNSRGAKNEAAVGNQVSADELQAESSFSSEVSGKKPSKPSKPDENTMHYSVAGDQKMRGQKGREAQYRQVGLKLDKAYLDMCKAEAAVQSGQDGSSPRGGNFMGTNDTEAFNVRHNGGRKTNTHGKKAEDLGNFP
tara:strand:+ start:61 stop:1716 length:1656 start_codon:yes stop_codon:yes gene_type:complete